MKKLVKYGVLPACLLLLAACSSKPATEKKAAKEDKVEQSSESKEEKTKSKCGWISLYSPGNVFLLLIYFVPDFFHNKEQPVQMGDSE